MHKVGLGLAGRRRRGGVLVALRGAERLKVAPPLAGGGGALRLGRHHVPQRVVQVAVQQAALVLGRRRGAVVAAGEDAALLLQCARVRRPGELRLADGCREAALFICGELHAKC